VYLMQHYILAGGIGFLGRDLMVTVREQGYLVPRLYPVGRLETLLGIVPALVLQKGFLWQPVTYLFLHGGFFHLFINMFTLWMFGGELERLWGTRRFLQYYFFTGVGAGLLTLLFTPRGYIPTIGASGAIYGLLLAYARYFPERRILLYFLFPIPVRVFVFIIGGIALLNSLGQPGDSIAHAAHLGGIVFGWIYLDWRRPGGPFGGWTRRRRGGGLRVIDFTREDDRI
ncbi:MAG: rhomboid family intramembrane serine protease, partial [Candidatus Eisenbacteria bacterium]|nr:rhomboid family intramembrane serine protease [Candidatus Eisenbacteria bacterium]